MKTFKVLSAFLSYPSEELKRESDLLWRALQDEGLVSAKALDGLRALSDEFQSRNLMDLQERYVLLFDRTRSLSLNLFEHIHGESRDRGQAMVDLLAHYQAHGLDLNSRQLPDHLPLFLEFLSILPEAEARELLADTHDILALLGARLEGRGSSYAGVLQALVYLAGGKMEIASEKPSEDPNDGVAIDKFWEDAPVTFGPGPQGGCPVAREQLAAMTANLGKGGA